MIITILPNMHSLLVIVIMELSTHNDHYRVMPTKVYSWHFSKVKSGKSEISV